MLCALFFEDCFYDLDVELIKFWCRSFFFSLFDFRFYMILVEKLSVDGTGQKMPGIYENAEVPDVSPSNETATPDNIDEKYKLENVRQNLSEDDENSSLSAHLSIENTSIGILDSEGSKLPESENEAIVEASAPEN
uniref:Uncharacterized protein n=1 Tax=Cacopsylla melanoneura TaxID=428564 RepID=A0A8D8R831_9HEMI